ncbi:MAG: PDZ domain-containing protein, partial [Parachlamydiales bacterium]|nr:PDZ domain-containing protein [Parachlamydiales bacterium]
CLFNKMDNMKKYLLIIFIIPCLIFTKSLTYGEINLVMDKIFKQHIEFEDFDETLVSRSLKVYIDNFDSMKIYLLADEVSSYLDLSSKKAKKVLKSIKDNEFLAFIELDDLFQKAILRAKDFRQKFIKEIIGKKIVADQEYTKNVAFAKDLDELYQRQKAVILNFFENQQKRSIIDTDEKEYKVFNLLEKKLKRSENRYLINEEGNLKENQISTNILKAFAKSLDAHTYFFSEDEAIDMRTSLEKQFEGVGLVLTESIDGVIVSGIIKNSPAEQSGVLKEGDIIVQINGKNTKGLSFDEVMSLMKSKDTSDIHLGFKRLLKNDQTYSYWNLKLTKQAISMDDQRLTCSYEPFADGIIAKLSLKSFYENSNGVTSEKDIKKAINSLKKDAQIKGLVLDLRDNSGGFLSQAIKVAGLFIKNGVVVISKSSKKDIRYLRTLDSSAFYNGPLIILTSKMSASASEIVAAALQDFGVALVVGDETTFGKGSIQYQTVTDKNADYFYKVTVGKYYTVSGRTTQIEGVRADINVPSEYSCYTVGERYLEYPLKSDTVKAAYKDNLSDLDGKIRMWFKQNYLPNLQKKVTFWQKMVPILKENSKVRLEKDLDFQNFLKKQENVKAKLNSQTLNIEYKNYGQEDIQMSEAVNILKDMIFIEAEKRKVSGF